MMATSWAAVGTNPCAPFWTPMRCRLLEKIGKVTYQSRSRCISWNYPHPGFQSPPGFWTILSRESWKSLHLWLLLRRGVDRMYFFCLTFKDFWVEFGIFYNWTNFLFQFPLGRVQLGILSTPSSLQNRGFTSKFPKNKTLPLDKHTKSIICPWKMSFVSKILAFHFHDCGRKCTVDEFFGDWLHDCNIWAMKNTLIV